MEILQLLGTALGLGALAGINLYLTVFVAGLAISQGWIVLAPEYEKLGVLGNEAIIIIAGVLYALQFFADKIPWVDSLWDLVHSFIRPIGGAFLAIAVLGEANPVYDVMIALLAGGVALSTHTLKAGARLIVNSSPEPFSNIALSFSEDVGVIGGLFLVQTYPAIALAVVIVLVASILYFGPKIARAIQVRLWLGWRKVAAYFSRSPLVDLPDALPAHIDISLHKLRGAASYTVEWAVPCITAGSKKTPANAAGYLIALRESPMELYFVGKRWFRTTAKAFDLTGCRVSSEVRFISENLVVYSVSRGSNGPNETFFFERGHRHLLAKVTTKLKSKVGGPVTQGGEGDIVGAPVSA